ncbi:hypothetical protein OBBRIDRAFT_102544 [Obba rivulosa]|uniref:NACHT domain-containing protein n=1 Tax=Obba rivulosa TaxID=1052685 RepID=A0A8E2J6V2_9APHY|nr:hypothetical protein OBBRIDRAFT_102544 [Obba rivulosa]
MPPRSSRSRSHTPNKSINSQAPRKSGRSSPSASRFTGNDSPVDAALSITRDAAGLAADLTSDLPVSGLSQAFSLLEALLTRIETTRSNKEQARDAVRSIKALRAALQASTEGIRQEARRMDPAERHVVEQTINASDELRRRIEGLRKQLNRVQHLAGRLHKRRWWSGFFYAKQDAELLGRINRRVREARKNFKIQGGIAVESLLAEVCDRLRQNEHDRLVRVHHDVLQTLNPADASYRSDLTEEKSRLQPGTRKNILEYLTQWATLADQPHRVLVLHGRAGMGKSSIVHALLRRLAGDHITASFFFNRGVDECRDAYRVFSTLAHQLANTDERLRALIVEAVRGHFAKGRSQTLDHQLEELLTRPLRRLPTPTLPILIAIDGVDECSNNINDIVRCMLELLCRAGHEIPFVRIFIATRPEE